MTVTVTVSSLKWGVLFARMAVDLALFVSAACFAFSLMHEVDEHMGSATPFQFDVYRLLPYQGLVDVSNVYKTKVLDKLMCVVAADGCTTAEQLRIDMREATDCTPNSMPRSPICTQCIDLYAERIHATVIGLADKRADSATEADVDLVEPLRNELEACISRTGGTRTVHYMFKTSPWVHLMLWNGLALIYTTAVFLFANTRVQQSIGLSLTSILFYMVCVAVIVVYIVLRASVPSFDKKELALSIPQLFVAVIVYPWALYEHNKGKGHSDKTFTFVFGLYMATTSPCIGIILNTFNSWLEFDMLNLTMTMLTTFFVLCMIDDLLSVYWSVQKEDSEAVHREHWYLHTYLLGVSLLLIVCFATLSLPVAPFGDKLSGNILFVVFVIFAVLYSVAPSFLYEHKITDTVGVIAYKEILEIMFRLITFTVMAHVYVRGVPVAL
jgi:hypothetical protein